MKYLSRFLLTLLAIFTATPALAVNLTDADAPYTPPTYVNFAVREGHYLPWLDAVNNWNAPAQFFTSNDPTVMPARIDTTGSITVGQTVGLRLYFNSTNHNYTYTIQSGDTPASINEDLIALIMGDSAVTAANIICGFQTATPSATIFCNAPYDKMPVISSIGNSTTITLTIAQSNGKVDLGPTIGFQRAIPGRLPLAGDVGPTLTFQMGTNDSGTPVLIGAEYAQIVSGIIDPTHGAPKGYLRMLTQGSYLEVNPDDLVYHKNGVSQKLGKQYGTCTIGIRGSATAGTPNYAARNCYYSVDGDDVQLHAFIALGSPAFTSAPSGYAMITGLPCSATYVPSANIGFLSNLTLSSGYTVTSIAGTNVNQSTLDLTETGSGKSVNAVPVGGVGNNFATRFSINYRGNGPCI